MTCCLWTPTRPAFLPQPGSSTAWEGGRLPHPPAATPSGRSPCQQEARALASLPLMMTSVRWGWG